MKTLTTHIAKHLSGTENDLRAEIDRLEEFRQQVARVMFTACDKRRQNAGDSEVLDGALDAINLALTACAKKSGRNVEGAYSPASDRPVFDSDADMADYYRIWGE